MKSTFTFLFCFFISLNLFSQKCFKDGLLISKYDKNESLITNGNFYKFKKLNYYGKNIIFIGYDNVTIKELVRKLTNKKIDTITKIQDWSTIKLSVYGNCNDYEGLTENKVKTDFLDKIVEIYGIKFINTNE
jgi:hypothetical protein